MEINAVASFVASGLVGIVAIVIFLCISHHGETVLNARKQLIINRLNAYYHAGHTSVTAETLAMEISPENPQQAFDTLLHLSRDGLVTITYSVALKLD